MWDTALADKLTGEFQLELHEWLESLQKDTKVDTVEVLHCLQELWKKHYMQTGHKRLARVFLRENFL